MQGGSQELPVVIFEASSLEGQASTSAIHGFSGVDYGIETGEAERIAVDGVAKGDMGQAEDEARALT